MMEMQFDTIFGVSGVEDMLNLFVANVLILQDLRLAAPIHIIYKDGTEINSHLVDTDTMRFKHIFITDDNIFNFIYVDQLTKFHIALYIPSVTPEYERLLTPSRDGNKFVVLKRFCKNDRLIIRGNTGYRGYIEYLLYKKTSVKSQLSDHKTDIGELRHDTILSISSNITNQTVSSEFMLPKDEYIQLGSYGALGRLVKTINKGNM